MPRQVWEDIFVGVYPAGLVYADKRREENGDYARLAFLSYATLRLEWHSSRPVDSAIREWIERDAAAVQARRGEAYQVSACGQTVKLGGANSTDGIATD